jgi:hypothetical protein
VVSTTGVDGVSGRWGDLKDEDCDVSSTSGVFAVRLMRVGIIRVFCLKRTRCKMAKLFSHRTGASEYGGVGGNVLVDWSRYRVG